MHSVEPTGAYFPTGHALHDELYWYVFSGHLYSTPASQYAPLGQVFSVFPSQYLSEPKPAQDTH